MGGEAVHGLQVGARRHRTEPQDLGAPNPRASTRPGAWASPSRRAGNLPNGCAYRELRSYWLHELALAAEYDDIGMRRAKPSRLSTRCRWNWRIFS